MSMQPAVLSGKPAVKKWAEREREGKILCQVLIDSDERKEGLRQLTERGMVRPKLFKGNDVVNHSTMQLYCKREQSSFS